MRQAFILFRKNETLPCLAVGAGTALTFAIGNKIEEIVIEKLGGHKPKPMGIRVGDIYIIGSPDIIVDDKYIVECKSINRDSYLLLSEPKPKHVAQISFYMWIAQKHKLPYSTTGAIVYIPKEEVREEIIKVFEIKLTDHYINLYNRILDEIKNSVKHKKLPKRICKSTNSYSAKRCNLVKECFNSED